MGKVLIIDDENQLRKLLSRIIGLEGYEVLQADSCKSGMKQLVGADPEVVLCDVCLPDGSGVDLVMEMKKKYTMAIVTHNMQQATRIWDSAAFSSRERWQGLVSPGGYSLCRVIKRMKITTQGDLDYDAQQV